MSRSLAQTQGDSVLIFVYTVVSNKNKVLTVFLFVLFLASFILAIDLFGQSTTTGPSSSGQSGDTASLWASAALGAFGDTVVALTLVSLLYRQKSHVTFTRTASMIDRIMMYTVGTGLLTAAFHITGLVTSIALTKDLVFITILEMVPKRGSNFPCTTK